MQKITLTLTNMAYGGAALGRDVSDRVLFVPFTIPGEKVTAEIVEDKKRFATARLVEMLEPSPDRVEPRCPHFGSCGECHFQHINYPAQIRYKAAVLSDQLARIGGFVDVSVKPVVANPEPWAYAIEASFSPTDDGGLGFWSPRLGRVMKIDTCHIIREQLVNLLHDTDLALPELRRLTLRVGEDDALLAALEVEDMEPPSLEADFPISVALVLPDGTAANLVGDNNLLQSVKGHLFRVSAGSFFYPSPPAIEILIDTILNYLGPDKIGTVLELYSGVGTITNFLSAKAVELVALEMNADAVADTAVNLNDYDNVTLYEGPVEEILPILDVRPDAMIVDPPVSGLPPMVTDEIARKAPAQLIYISSDAATLARDGRRLAAHGYLLKEVQPIDMYPQTYRILAVSHWHRTDFLAMNV